MSTLDSEYLKASVGAVLAAGIAETVAEQPEDPVGYLAQYLLKSVADEKSGKALAAAQKTDAAATAEAAAAAAAAEKAATDKTEALAAQASKEDERLTALLESASTSDEVYGAVLSYARARTGASGYVMLTDIPEKILPKKVEPAPAEEPAEPVEGEEPPPEPEPEAEAEPRVPFKPTVIEYVAATGPDEALLVGKTLARPPAGEGEEGEEAASPALGTGEGVTFTAIDGFISGTPVFHEPAAVENRSVKFWYMPRIGAYACAPFADYEGDVCGALGFDTLGLERAFSAEELALLESLASKTGATLMRIEEGLAEKHHALMAKLETAYPKDAESGAFPAYAPPEGEEPIDSAKGAVAIPAAVLAELTADDVLHLGTRRTIPPAYLMALKGALALVSDSEKFDASLTDATWDGVKEGVHMGDLMWGAELFAALGALDVMGGAGSEVGWEVASAMAAALATADEESGAVPKDSLVADASLLLGKVVADWLLATVALYTAKKEKEAAEAAAAAEPAAEEEAEE